MLNIYAVLYGVMKCKNAGCNNLIQCHQPNWEKDYCDNDCDQAAQHYRTITNASPRKNFIVPINQDREIYPHKWLDVQIVIEQENWWDRINATIEKLSPKK